MTKAQAYMISQIGDEGSEIRQRADEIFNYMIMPVAKEPEFDLKVLRSDLDPTPGQVTSRLIRGILNSAVVVADLTGRNANVYYELAVVHSFNRPVVILVDTANSLSFDTQNERVIEIGDDGNNIGVSQAEQAKRKLREALRLVLDEEYKPESLITEVAGSQTLADLAPDNPIAAQLETILDRVNRLYAMQSRSGGLNRSDLTAVLTFLQHLVSQGRLVKSDIGEMISIETSSAFDSFMESLLEGIEAQPENQGGDDW